jgi:hypothetical protein
MTFLIVHTDHGKYGSEMRGTPSLTRREIVSDFVSGQFSDTGTRGLLQVFEVSPESGIVADITAEIAHSAWEYIDANSDDCGGNELRLLQEHGLVPDDVERIEGGIYQYHGASAERSREGYGSYRTIMGKAA